MNPNEIWQIDVNGQIYETSFQELTQWIDEGSLMPGDKVRRGNVRWLEAGKIPTLFGFFNAKELGQPMPQIQFSSPESEITAVKSPPQSANFAATQNFSPAQTDYLPMNNFTVNENLPPTENFTPIPQNEATYYQPHFDAQTLNNNVCVIHNNAEPHYVCETCTSLLCEACPKGYGGNVKICPMCGAMCVSIKQIQEDSAEKIQFERDMKEGFGIADFGRALVYPFKYKVSLFFGAFFFMLATLGQSAAGAGSFMMFGAVIICFMMANMMTFAVLANTVENFSQGKVGGNFMPTFDDFSLWDDMIHPFFLSLGVYLVSFGLTIVFVAGSVWVMWNSVTKEIKKDSDAAIAVIKKKEAEKLKANPTPQTIWNDNDRAFQADVDNMNKELQIDKLKSLGAADPGADMNTNQIGVIILKNVGLFVIPIILSLLWGIFYYPIACAVAGYTRSFSATINPTIGLETIKLIGGADYAKILGMTLLISVITGLITLTLNFILAPFYLPRMGNLPAIAIGSWFTFYFSVVFAVMLGYAMYKNTRKLNLSGAYS